MTNLPIYRLTGNWKGEDVRSHPLLLLQVGLPVDADIDNSMISNIACQFGMTPAYTGLGAQFYFEIDDAERATAVRVQLISAGYRDADFVGSK